MKKLHKEYDYRQGWEYVVWTYLSRYPTSPYFPRMLDHVVVDVAWDPSTQQFSCTKRMTIETPVPKVLRKMARASKTYVFQTLRINIGQRIMEETSRNRAGAKKYHLSEVARWVATDADGTHFLEDATIEINPKVPGVVAGIVVKEIEKEYNRGFEEARAVDKLLMDERRVQIDGLEVVQEFCLRQFKHQGRSDILDFSAAFHIALETAPPSGEFL